MLQFKKSVAALACWSLVSVAFPVLSAAVGPPPGAVQAPAARALVRGPEIGGRTMAVVGDPQKAAALGLPGLAAGDTVEVARPDSEKWTVTDPKTGRVVESRQEPDLGR